MASSSQEFPPTPSTNSTEPSDKASSSPGKHSPSPEQCCSICLSQFKDKSFTDSCFHTFCFSCLQEWAKVKAVCPLCKTSFNSIIHNIKSSEEYERIYLPSPSNSTDDEARRFRYATTLTQERRFLLEERRMRQFARDARRDERRRREETSLSRRRLIYSAGLRVLHMGSNEYSQFRDISPQFFSGNPAVTHRLVPWLRRELSVLFDNQDEHVTFMTHYILSLITNVDIQSEEFHMNLRPFLHDTVEHFIHEFANFARSPYDMEAYDQMSQYDFSGSGVGRTARALPRRTNQPLVAFLQQLDSDSDEPSVILLSDHDSEAMVISDGNASDDNIEIEQVSNIEVAILPTSTSIVNEDITVDYSAYQPPVFTIHDDSPTINPEPPIDINLPGPSGLQSVAAAAPPPLPAAPSPPPLPVALDVSEEIHIKEEPPDFHDSDHSDIEFIAFLQPAHLRTPEQFMCSSESETERVAHIEGERRWQEEKARRKTIRDRMKQMLANAEKSRKSKNTTKDTSHRSRSNSYDRRHYSNRRSRSQESRHHRSRSSDIHIYHRVRSRSRDLHTRARSRSKTKTPPAKTWRERFGYAADSSPSPPPRVPSKASKKKVRTQARRENFESNTNRSHNARSRSSRERSSSRNRLEDSRSKRGSSRSRRDDDSRRNRREQERSRDEDPRSRKEDRSRNEDLRSRREHSRSRDEDPRSRRGQSRSRDEDPRSRKEHSRSRDEDPRSRRGQSRSRDEDPRSRRGHLKSRDEDPTSRSRREHSRSRDERSESRSKSYRDSHSNHKKKKHSKRRSRSR